MEQRKLTGNMTDVYKIKIGINRIDYRNLLLIAELDKTEGYRYWGRGKRFRRGLWRPFSHREW